MSLVASWLLNEQPGVAAVTATDSSGHANDHEGTLVTDADPTHGQIIPGGPHGTCMYHQANNYYYMLDCLNKADLNLPGEMAVMFWLYRINESAFNVLSFGAAGELAADNTQYGVDVIANNEIMFWWENGAGADVTVITPAWSLPPSNEWTHVAVIRFNDGVDYQVQIFINGVVVKHQLGCIGPSGGANGVIGIGYFNDSGASMNVDFAVSEVRIYDNVGGLPGVGDVLSAYEYGLTLLDRWSPLVSDPTVEESVVDEDLIDVNVSGFRHYSFNPGHHTGFLS